MNSAQAVILHYREKVGRGMAKAWTLTTESTRSNRAEPDTVDAAAEGSNTGGDATKRTHGQALAGREPKTKQAKLDTNGGVQVQEPTESTPAGRKGGKKQEPQSGEKQEQKGGKPTESLTKEWTIIVVIVVVVVVVVVVWKNLNVIKLLCRCYLND